MNEQVFAEARRKTRLIIQESQLAPIEYLLVATTILMEHMNVFLEACPTEQMRREVRKGLHAFPEAITQFIHAWQPGRASVSYENGLRILVEKWRMAMSDAEASTRNYVSSHPTHKGGNRA